MPAPIGHRRWAIAEGYIPAHSHGPSPEMVSHETVCILNVSGEPAELRITVYFDDRDPAGPYRLRVEPQRTVHLRLGELDDPEPIPEATDYATLVESSVSVVVQHSRLDSRQAENALMSAMAFGAD